MYDHNSNSGLLESALLATVGAGIVTSFAISQGQHPLHALLITLTAASFALLCQQCSQR
ncbi:hypothetical protein PN441_12050 [Spirulina major CS-329]|uniref:hypothetical protein n=1 Tax=Spirulina TaxID=1154 RepID=UPI00232E0183|nr:MULTISPECIES: hypothetical protein [Spirulina]MDB9496631.1 hypothetical protein [Spirulina subsalsa CS-330]MDB9503806.1 hypothetical protein [Spirulina major CS-329]